MTSFATAEGDGLDHAIDAAIGLCRSSRPALARDLELLIGRQILARTEVIECEDDHLIVALRILVLVAARIDDGRLGSVLACIRCVAIESDMISRQVRTLH